MPFLFNDEVETTIHTLPATADEMFIKRLDTLIKKCADYLNSESGALYNYLFLRAVRAHYLPEDREHEHIYMQQYEIPQIVLFDILTNKLPFVTSSHTIVNATISDMLRDVASAAIIDIGIGRGVQMVRLIDKLSENTQLQKLTIIGIEPFQIAIEHAQQLISDKKAPFHIDFIPVIAFAEHLTTERLQQLLPQQYDRLIVNASLILHHLQSEDERRRMFDLIGTLQPYAVVLTEPYSDHMTADWRQRVINAYIHYGGVFSMIDSLEIGDKEKNGLKLFFGREINDVVGNPEELRYERHEPGEKWVAYLKESNFKPAEKIDTTVITEKSNVVFHQDRGFLTMKHNNIDILAIITGLRM